MSGTIPLLLVRRLLTASRLTYFQASCWLVNEERERCNLDSIMAMILQARYLLSTSTFSKAHEVLSAAMSAATRMGLHLDDSTLRSTLTTSDLYERRRVFAVLYMMDTYLAFALGLPRTLRSADVGQTLGLPENSLLDEGEALIAQHPSSSIAETILSQKLYRIYAKIQDHEQQDDADRWMAPAKVSEVEEDLRNWENGLPNLPPDLTDKRILLGQLVLRLQFAGAQLMLYAPCVHHLGRDSSDPLYNLAGFGYGSACVRAATQAVLLCETLQAQEILSEPFWLNRYILAWSANILAYFVIHSRTRVTIRESRSAALKAANMLQALGTRNPRTNRIHECISPYMEVVQSLDT